MKKTMFTFVMVILGISLITPVLGYVPPVIIKTGSKTYTVEDTWLYTGGWLKSKLNYEKWSDGSFTYSYTTEYGGISDLSFLVVGWGPGFITRFDDFGSYVQLEYTGITYRNVYGGGIWYTRYCYIHTFIKFYPSTLKFQTSVTHFIYD